MKKALSGWLALAAFCCGAHGMADTLDVWHTEVAQTRNLAENDARRAQSLKLEAGTRLNQPQAAERHERKLQRLWLWTVLGGGIVLLVGAVYFIFRLRRSREEIRGLNAILERRVQERTAELRQQTSYLRALIDTLPMPVWLKDTERRFLTVNRAAADFLGVEIEEAVGKTYRDFQPPEGADSAEADEAEVMATRRKNVVEARLHGPNGPSWREIYMAPVLDEDGSVLGTVGFDRDISESKAMEAAHETALEEARQLARMRSEFMAQISHELRTPLNGILGYAQILQRDGAMSEEQLEGLNIIRQSGDHLLSLINNILDHVSLDAEVLELNPGDIHLARFFHAVSGGARLKAAQKGLDFVFEMAANVPSVIWADEQRLRQVLTNLLDNAVKFTEQGSVRLRVGFSASARLRVEVEDTGPGIAEDHRESVFRPFVRGSVTHRWYGGTGLGLPVSRKLARMMGGDLKAERAPGGGSLFLFEVEVVAVGPGPSEAGRDAPGSGIAPATELFPPPARELEILYELAKRGNMKKLADRALYLRGLGERYLPFADELRLLAKGYQSQAVLNLVEQYRERRHEGVATDAGPGRLGMTTGV